MDKQQIVAKLPYSSPFLFVDEIMSVNENGIEGTFTFDANLDFYKGHFKNNPVTPGVILIETMAQIGLVCLGIYLNDGNEIKNIAFTSSEVEFLKPVYPDEKVIIVAEKIYYRFGKLKCKVKMTNAAQEVVCTGTLAGIIV
ncbi:hydroxymyristoyl-ACP dehydratase [Flavobacterium faecale]|uniref:Hydroxymyristoyl-ACP dehydratase n=1 Tax=Flavobacterium faecale TaxID=1355330 RepID=A0A2S1LDD9_9FLAO|nr:3-hydroxyacyl-ACP dehydratase FabZ family protein [Flavobacterium faecale]AWG21728.1 hydroxymyristoyl-ACP dehydratase [Flavobacterium faecale]